MLTNFFKSLKFFDEIDFKYIFYDIEDIEYQEI
jgi:hypothetical protein